MEAGALLYLRAKSGNTAIMMSSNREVQDYLASNMEFPFKAIWKTNLFSGQFLDPYLSSNNLNYGTGNEAIEAIIAVLGSLLRNPDDYLYLLEPSHIKAIETIVDIFRNSKTFLLKFDAARGFDSLKVSELLDYVIEQIINMREGDRMIVPGGWTPSVNKTGHAVA